MGRVLTPTRSSSVRSSYSVARTPTINDGGYIVHLFKDFMAAQNHGLILSFDVVLTIIVIESLSELFGLLANAGEADILQIAPEVAQPLIALPIHLSVIS